MALGLKTRRYAVVVLSCEFLPKQDLCQELEYAYRRMKWIRKHHPGWDSHYVILYGRMAEDYEKSEFCILELYFKVILREFDSKKGKVKRP